MASVKAQTYILTLIMVGVSMKYIKNETKYELEPGIENYTNASDPALSGNIDDAINVTYLVTSPNHMEDRELDTLVDSSKRTLSNVTINLIRDQHNYTFVHTKAELINTSTDAFKDKVLSAVNDKCATIDHTDEGPAFERNRLNSIYLNNIHSSVTTNLIDDNVTIESIESNGVSLFDMVRGDCGGAKVCAHYNGNWSDKKTITIGFLSAYGYSQVRHAYLCVFVYRNILAGRVTQFQIYDLCCD